MKNYHAIFKIFFLKLFWYFSGSGQSNEEFFHIIDVVRYADGSAWPSEKIFLEFSVCSSRTTVHRASRESNIHFIKQSRYGIW